ASGIRQGCRCPRRARCGHVRGRHTDGRIDRYDRDRLRRVDGGGGVAEVERARQVKILTLDIETRPNLAYIWGLWDQNAGLNQVAEFGSVISFAAKWHGKKPVEFRSDFHDGHTAMVQRAWELIDEADVVVGYNSKSFDMKHLKREFVLAGMTPPSPH